MIGWQCKCGVLTKIDFSEKDYNANRFSNLDSAIQRAGGKCQCGKNFWPRYGKPVKWPDDYLLVDRGTYL